MENQTVETATTVLAQILEAMQQSAKTCATVANDKTEQALTGEASQKDTCTQDAKEWTIKSQVWLEAEAVVRRFISGESCTNEKLAPGSSQSI